MSNTCPESNPEPLTHRQRAICRAYFANGCRTKAAARALGINSSRVRAVKATPAGRAYLDSLDAEACAMLSTAMAARILAPMLD